MPRTSAASWRDSGLDQWPAAISFTILTVPSFIFAEKSASTSEAFSWALREGSVSARRSRASVLTRSDRPKKSSAIRIAGAPGTARASSRFDE